MGLNPAADTDRPLCGVGRRVVLFHQIGFVRRGVDRAGDHLQILLTCLSSGCAHRFTLVPRPRRA